MHRILFSCKDKQTSTRYVLILNPEPSFMITTLGLEVWVCLLPVDGSVRHAGASADTSMDSIMASQGPSIKSAPTSTSLWAS